jgi:hypothetical protein
MGKGPRGIPPGGRDAAPSASVVEAPALSPIGLRPIDVGC